MTGPLLSMAQEELVMYPFSRIRDYGSSSELFHMSIRTVKKGSDFVCETSHVSGRSHRVGIKTHEQMSADNVNVLPCLG